MTCNIQKLCFNNNTQLSFEIFSDTDYAGDIKDDVQRRTIYLNTGNL